MRPDRRVEISNSFIPAPRCDRCGYKVKEPGKARYKVRVKKKDGERQLALDRQAQLANRGELARLHPSLDI